MRCGDGLEVGASEPRREGRNSGRLLPNPLSVIFIYICITLLYRVYVCDVARQRRERSQGRRWLKTAGESRRFAGSGSPRAAGGRRDPMQRGKAPRRFGTRPTGRPWRGVARPRSAGPRGGELPSAARVACWLCGSRATGSGPGRPPPPRLPRVTALHTPLPPRTAQKGSFPLLSPTQCLFPYLKKKNTTKSQLQCR